MAEGYGVDKNLLHKCALMWSELGMFGYSLDNQSRGWYFRGGATNLSAWLYLDFFWLAELYIRLVHNAREYQLRRGMVAVCPGKNISNSL